MSKLSVLYFACHRDFDLLKESAKRFIDYDDVTVIASFDEEDEIPKKAPPGVDAIITSEFPRGYSLNQSPECIVGMLKQYQEVCQETECDALLKIDSDTALTGDLNLVPVGHYDMVGQEGIIETSSLGEKAFTYTYGKGHAYMLSATIIRRMAGYRIDELLSAVNAFSNGLLAQNPQTTWPEDEAFSLMVRMLMPDPNRIKLIPDDSTFTNFVSNWDFDLETASPGIFTNYGNLYGVKKDDGRELILDAMKGDA